MERIYERCAGLDVHKKSVAACVRVQQGRAVQQEVRVFGTMSRDLLALRDWLRQWQVTHVAMESTGVYWHPVWNLLEDAFTLLLANAQHIRNVPGRKTDIKDCEWIAQLLQHGLLRPSFVPPEAQREVRELTRMRTTLVQDRSRIINRLQKTLESANIKLASVATDITGVSGLAILQALADGETDARQLAERSRGRLRAKLAEMEQALAGRMTAHHRFVLRQLLDQLAFFNDQVLALEERIEALMVPFEAAVGRLLTLPFGSRMSFSSLLAEIGTDMSRFPTAQHLAKWAGMCPGNHESAGKRKSGKPAPGNRWLKGILNQLGWAASRTQGTSLKSMYHRLAARRGKKRAIVAVGHAILVIIWNLLKHGTTYQELGPDYLDRQNAEHVTRRLVKRLEHLGFTVSLTPTPTAA